MSPAEERAFIDWINRLLGSDPDLKHHLPIDYTVDGQLYDRCRDGLLLCKLINTAVPDTIDERCINKAPTKSNIFKVIHKFDIAILKEIIVNVQWKTNESHSYSAGHISKIAV